MDTPSSAPRRGTGAVFTPGYRAVTILGGWVIVAITWGVSTANGGENMAWAPALLLAWITGTWFNGGSVRAVTRRYGLGALAGPAPSQRS